MNTNESAPAPRATWRRVVLWTLLACGLAVIAVAAVAVNTITLNREARLMRNEMLTALNARSHTQVQLTVGPALIGTVRLGLAFFHEVPPEARMALRAVNAASVGVYKLDARPGELPIRKLFADSDRVMTRRGWNRVVGVNQNGTAVLIYMPAKSSDHGVQRVCVAVCKRDQLVVVSASGDSDPLVELAASQGALARL